MEKFLIPIVNKQYFLKNAHTVQREEKRAEQEDNEVQFVCSSDGKTAEEEENERQRNRRRRKSAIFASELQQPSNKRRSIRLQKSETTNASTENAEAVPVATVQKEEAVELPVKKKRQKKPDVVLNMIVGEPPAGLKPVLRKTLSENFSQLSNSARPQKAKSVQFDEQVTVHVIKPRKPSWDSRKLNLYEVAEEAAKYVGKSKEEIQALMKPDECRLTFAQLDISPTSHRQIYDYFHGPSAAENSLNDAPLTFNCSMLPDHDTWIELKKRKMETEAKGDEKQKQEETANEEKEVIKEDEAAKEEIKQKEEAEAEERQDEDGESQIDVRLNLKTETQETAVEEEEVKVNDRYEWMRKKQDEGERAEDAQRERVQMQQGRTVHDFSTDPDVQLLLQSLNEQEENWWQRLLQIRENMQTDACLSCLPWVELLAPSKIEEWIGSELQAEKAKTFVQRWQRRVKRYIDKDKKKPENNKCKKSKRRKSSNDSDSDYEEEEEGGQLPNPLVLVGRSGTGKTALIRSLARELHMATVELNLSDPRGARDVRARLVQAVTQHKVSHHAFFSPMINFKTVEQNLIVIDDIDVRFPSSAKENSGKREKGEEETDSPDQGFARTIIEVTNMAKVPIIWTCQKREAAEELMHLAEKQGLQIEFRPEIVELECEPRQIASYLQLILLAIGNVFVCRDSLLLPVEVAAFDIRSLLSQAQLSASQPALEFEWQSLRSEYPNDSCALKFAQYSEAEIREERKQRMDKECRKALSSATMSHHMRDTQKKCSSALRTISNCLEGQFSHRQLASEVVPFLASIDKKESRRAKHIRRYMHYFDEVEQGMETARVPHGDTLKALLPNFRHFSSSSPPPPIPTPLITSVASNDADSSLLFPRSPIY